MRSDLFSCSQISVNLLHLPDDLLLEDGQDGVVVANLLEHHTTVELVAHFLEVEPEHKHKCETSVCRSTSVRSPRLKPVHGVRLPVVALFGKELLELAQRHHAAFDRCSVWNRLSTKVVSHRHVLAHLTLPRLVPET